MPDLLLPNPPPPPTISGTSITLNTYLQNPARVRRLMEDLTRQRFIADQIYGTGPKATGGAVVYDQVTANDLYTSRDVQEIAPGAEFPILNDAAPAPLAALVAKWGGRIKISDEARDRNDLNLFTRETTKLSNTIVRKVDSIAIAVLDAAPIGTTTGADWSTAGTDVIGFLAGLRAIVDALDMGYVLDKLIINTVQGAELIGRSAILTALTEVSSEAQIRNATIGRLMGFDIYTSNRVTAGTGYAVASKVVGGISDEVPQRTVTYREEKEESTFIQSARRLVPYVTDPKAAIKFTGI